MARVKIVPLDRKKSLYLKHTESRGRGVFCRETIRKGEVLETTPTIVLNERETDRTLKTFLGDYIFGLGRVSKEKLRVCGIKNIDDASCVIMGITSFCNHAKNPNAEVIWEEKDGTLYHILVARRSIPKDTEICTDYGRGWFDDRKQRLVP